MTPEQYHDNLIKIDKAKETKLPWLLKTRNAKERLCQRIGYEDGLKHSLFPKIVQWGHDRGIIAKSTSMLQFNKTMEEVQELEEAIISGDLPEIKDAIGDITVTLVLQAEMNGLDFIDCVQSAYDIISKRKGKMVNGIFVKES